MDFKKEFHHAAENMTIIADPAELLNTTRDSDIKLKAKMQILGETVHFTLRETRLAEELTIHTTKATRVVYGTAGQIEEYIHDRHHRIIHEVEMAIRGRSASHRIRRRQWFAKYREEALEILKDFTEEEREEILYVVSRMRGYGSTHWGTVACRIIAAIGKDKLLKDEAFISAVIDLRNGWGVFEGNVCRDFDPNKHFISRAAINAAEASVALGWLIDKFKYMKFMSMSCPRITYAMDVILAMRNHFLKATSNEEKAEDVKPEAKSKKEKPKKKPEHNDAEILQSVEEQREYRDHAPATKAQLESLLSLTN